jgi:nitrate reductase NapE component
MVQNEVPVSEEAYDIFTFLSGMGLWLILAVALIILVLYKKFKK